MPRIGLHVGNVAIVVARLSRWLSTADAAPCTALSLAVGEGTSPPNNSFLTRTNFIIRPIPKYMKVYAQWAWVCIAMHYL